jgi:hypothetical protein
MEPYCQPAVYHKWYRARIEAGDEQVCVDTDEGYQHACCPYAPIMCCSFHPASQAKDELVCSIQRCMRRVTKAQVRDQLGIPPQTEEV